MPPGNKRKADTAGFHGFVRMLRRPTSQNKIRTRIEDELSILQNNAKVKAATVYYPASSFDSLEEYENLRQHCTPKRLADDKGNTDRKTWIEYIQSIEKLNKLIRAAKGTRIPEDLRVRQTPEGFKWRPASGLCIDKNETYAPGVYTKMDKIGIMYSRYTCCPFYHHRDIYSCLIDTNRFCYENLTSGMDPNENKQVTTRKVRDKATARARKNYRDNVEQDDGEHVEIPTEAWRESRDDMLSIRRPWRPRNDEALLDPCCNDICGIILLYPMTADKAKSADVILKTLRQAGITRNLDIVLYNEPDSRMIKIDEQKLSACADDDQKSIFEVNRQAQDVGEALEDVKISKAGMRLIEDDDEIKGVNF